MIGAIVGGWVYSIDKSRGRRSRFFFYPMKPFASVPNLVKVSLTQINYFDDVKGARHEIFDLWFFFTKHFRLLHLGS
jgi:hypothetical protein